MTDAPLTLSDNPLNPLEELLYAGLVDAGRMGAFERVMLQADLYAVPEAGSPGAAPGDDGAKVLRPGEQLILRGVVLDDGRETVTLFTDPRRAAALFGEEVRVVAMQGRKLLEILRDTVVLLNPDGGKGLLMQPDQIRAILGHAPETPPRRVTGRAELHDVAPDHAPVALVAALREVFQPPRAVQVWLARALWPDSGQIGWFADIRTDQPADEIRALAERAVRGLSFGTETLDVGVAGPGGEDGVGLRVV